MQEIPRRSRFPVSRRANLFPALLVRAFLPLFGLTALCHAGTAAPAVPDPGPDFKYQGEYAPKAGTANPKLGAQIVAMGSGRFQAAFLTGGLPGAGWDLVGRVEQTGTAQSGGVGFAAADPAKQYAATLSADGSTLSGTTPKGEAFSLEKIARISPTLGAPPPSGALVLFNGTDLSALVSGTAVLENGQLLPTGSAATGALTKKSFGSFTLHLEFLEPFMPDATDQARGNSGIYLQGRYELQILDSFGLNLDRGTPGAATQECGAFYQLARPKLNMSLPPLAWQTYDIDFTKARFDAQGKTLIDQAVVTVRQNGEIIHDGQKLLSQTLLGDPVTAADGPLRFQAHGDPVLYRNIWIVENQGSAVRPVPRKGRPGKSRRAAFGSPAPGSASLAGRQVGGALAAGYYFYRPGAL